MPSILDTLGIYVIYNWPCFSCFDPIKSHSSPYQFRTPFSTKWKHIVTFVPLSEWSRINGNNSILHQSLGSHQFIVRCIVHYINNASFPGTTLRTPREISRIQSESSVFLIASSCTNLVYENRYIRYFQNNKKLFHLCEINLSFSKFGK